MAKHPAKVSARVAAVAAGVAADADEHDVRLKALRRQRNRPRKLGRPPKLSRSRKMPHLNGDGVGAVADARILVPKERNRQLRKPWPPTARQWSSGR